MSSAGDLTRISFDQDDIENVLSRLEKGDIDRLAFGAIQLDAGGKILYFSEKEGELTNRRPDEMVGRSFFDDVAPCTKRPEFHGRFVEGVRTGKLNVVFEYVFDYKMSPTRVKVHMKKAIRGDSYWVLVSRADAR